MDYSALVKMEQEGASDNDLVRRNLPLAIWLARRSPYKWVDFEERLAVANLALCEAAAAYPTSKARQAGQPFSWFATRAIRDALQEASVNHWTFKVSRTVRRRARDAARKAELLEQRLNREPTDAEVAAELGWSPEQVRRLRQLLQQREPLSLDLPVPRGEKETTTEAEELPDPTVDVEEEVVGAITRQQERAALVQAIESLGPVSRTALSLRAGIPVPSTQELTAAAVFRAGASLYDMSRHAMKLLRGRHARAIRPDAEPAPVVPGDGRHSHIFGRAPDAKDKAPGSYRPEDIWRRLARDPGLPKPLASYAQRAGSVRPAAR